MFKELPQRIEWLASQVVDIEYRIHKELGPGLLESVYVKCFCFELERRNIFFEVNKEVAILYQSVEIESCLRLDVLVENAIVIEFKAQEKFSSSLASTTP